MAQKLALPLNVCTIQAMYQSDSNPAYQHEWDEDGHFGLDMTGYHNPFYASGKGKVVGVGGTATTGVGYWIAIQYNDVYKWNLDGSLEVLPAIVMRYFHLASKPSLSIGTAVTLETKIGAYSNTGAWSASMGDHLHIEVSTDTKNPTETPTLRGAAGGLTAGDRRFPTTFSPCYILFTKTTKPEEQSLSYKQSYCDKHAYGAEPYINVAMMKKFIAMTF